MAKKYLKVSTIPGQWYVSEGWQSGMTDRSGDLVSRHEHFNQLGQLVLAGPFVTRSDAEIWNTKHADGHASVWQQN
jgi:hypothetical protein